MPKDKITPKKVTRRQHGIKWKMFSIILVFILLFTMVIWVFQIQMLLYFYQGVKYRELNATYDSILSVKDNELKITERVRRRAVETDDDIWVYRIENQSFDEDTPFAFSEVSHDSRKFLLQRSFKEFYLAAKNNSNHYIGVFDFKTFPFDKLDDNNGEPAGIPYIHTNISNANAMRFDVIPLEDGSELLVVQRTKLTPMSALVDTIKTQVIFTSIVLITFSAVLVIVMSRFITIPIIRINESAKSLAKGKYDVTFKGDNYREISELSDTLNYAAVELSKNDNLQKELISNISHDLRTPLTMIRGYSELMRDIPGEVTPENFQVIIDEATRLAELVNGMLDLSKIQSGVRLPDKQVFCLTEIIKSTLIRYEKLVTQEAYKIDFIYEDEAYVCADRSMILQVVYNFINNAINYTGEDKYVRVEQKIIDEKIRISITDTGEGISDEQIPYIWDRYYKVDKVHRRATVGTGLGLSIVKSVLEAHEATYGVESEIGKGSTFYFELNHVNPSEYDVDFFNY